MKISSPGRFRITADTTLEGVVDEEARIASAPSHFTTKGMYLSSLLSRFDEPELDQIRPLLRSLPRHGVYQPFLDYPWADAVVLLHAVAKKQFPSVNLLQALRLLGRGSIKIYLKSQPGRVVKAMIEGPRDAFLKLPDIWKATDPQSSATVEELGRTKVRLEVHGFPAWLDCGVIGTIEQIVMNHEHTPTIDVDLRGPTHGVFIVEWQ